MDTISNDRIDETIEDELRRAAFWASVAKTYPEVTTWEAFTEMFQYCSCEACSWDHEYVLQDAARVKTTIETAIARGKAEIIADIAEGIVPTTVSTFSELHDFVDANEYGGLTEDAFIAAFHGGWPVVLAAVGKVQDSLNQWLADKDN